MAHPPPQHRTLQPTGPPAPRPRLDESLDAIRQEFELMTQELNAMRGQRDEYEQKSAWLNSIFCSIVSYVFVALSFDIWISFNFMSIFGSLVV